MQPNLKKTKRKVKNLIYIGNKLSKQGRSVTSIETLGNLLHKEGFDIRYASSKKNQYFRLLDMLFTIFKCRKWADYIIIDTYSSSAFWYAYLSARLADFYQINYIPILRGGNLPTRLKKNPKLSQQLFNKAKVNIAPSHYLLEAFQKAAYTNLKYIPNTIQIEKYPFRLRTKAKPKLLYVRSFAHIYNPILALKVLKEVIKTYPEATLSMVGPFKDDSIKECKAFAEQYDLPVTFNGGMQKEEWLAYAKNFDIFINTTNVDNTPVSVMEAMALGLPVVTTNVGGIPYLLNEDEAMLVPPDNVKAMLNAIKTLIQSPNLVEKHSFQGRKKVEAFDWSIIKKEWLKMYT